MSPPRTRSKSSLLPIGSNDLESDDKAIQTLESHVEMEVHGEPSPTATNTIQDDTGLDGKKGGKAGGSLNQKQKRKKKKDTAVVFGKVLVREYSRCLSMDGVPEEGGWPLGLSSNLFAEYEAADSVDSFEMDKQAKLKARWKELHPDDDSEPPTPLETRQWDYKADEDNPLFRKLSEQERMRILIADSEGKSVDTYKRSPARKVRSTRSRPKEQYNDIYSEVDVERNKKELQETRNQRKEKGSKGCTCKKLVVYSQKMTRPKVREELQRRNLLPTDEPRKKKKELQQLLHDAVEKEPCCANDCECVRNGIECHEDFCSCLSNEKKPTNPLLPRCGNPDGMYIYYKETVESNREKFLCQPVQNRGLEN